MSNLVKLKINPRIFIEKEGFLSKKEGFLSNKDKVELRNVTLFEMVSKHRKTSIYPLIFFYTKYLVTRKHVLYSNKLHTLPCFFLAHQTMSLL